MKTPSVLISAKRQNPTRMSRWKLVSNLKMLYSGSRYRPCIRWKWLLTLRSALYLSISRETNSIINHRPGPVVDIIATKCAVEYARKWAVDDEKGPLLLASEFITYRYGRHPYVFFLFSSSFCDLNM
jgi:hypothetical protein